MPMQLTAELTAVKCEFSDEKSCNSFLILFSLTFILWVEVKTAISEGSNGYPKSCLGAKQQKIVSTPVNSSFTA